MSNLEFSFPITIYGQAEQINDVLTKARCRIFYRGLNRNGTYITDEFAEMLVNTLHYVPVKGIFENGDYTDHGARRDEGRIYGIVPKDNNFAWEPFIDEDGVERVYACSDVYIYTALYPEASQIVGKSLSMELYERSLKYHRAIMQGQMCVVFDSGSFLGLQVLGTEVEPCFEGASFYSLQQTIEEAINKIEQYSILGGELEMPKINFKLSDDQKLSYLWTLLNPNYNEEGEWTVEYSICDVYEDYAIAYNIGTHQYERIYYTKNDESDSVEITNHVQVFIVDVTEQEKSVLDSLQQLNGGNYELLNENLVNAEKNANDCAEFSTKIEELNNVVSTLNVEISDAQEKIQTIETQYSEAQAQIATISEEKENLETYKKNMENQLKEAVVTEYTNILPEDIIESYRGQFDKYTVEELDMHLAYESKKNNSSVFTQSNSKGKLPKETQRSGVEKILEQYVK